MTFNLISVTVCIVASVVLLNVSPCTCSKNACYGAAAVTPGISFRLKDSTGMDIFTTNGTVRPVPDSVKLKDLRTGIFYPLFMGQEPGGALIYSILYARPANIVDSLVFSFGSSRPDTLIINTAMVDSWRGDECPAVKSPGISKVVLRSQVLLETNDDNAIFTIRK